MTWVACDGMDQRMMMMIPCPFQSAGQQQSVSWCRYSTEMKRSWCVGRTECFILLCPFTCRFSDPGYNNRSDNDETTNSGRNKHWNGGGDRAGDGMVSSSIGGGGGGVVRGTGDRFSSGSISATSRSGSSSITSHNSQDQQHRSLPPGGHEAKSSSSSSRHGKMLGTLLEQINLLHETNSKICRNLHETKGGWNCAREVVLVIVDLVTNCGDGLLLLLWLCLLLEACRLMFSNWIPDWWPDAVKLSATVEWWHTIIFAICILNCLNRAVDSGRLVCMCANRSVDWFLLCK